MTSLNPRHAFTETVTFLGDSITEQWSVHRPELFESNHFINCGVGGETTRLIKRRLAAVVADTRPRFIHLLCGINDIAELDGPFDISQTRNNITEMIDIAVEAGVPVAIGAVMPAFFNWKPQIQPHHNIDLLNRFIRTQAALRGCLFIDYNSPLRSRRNFIHSEMTIDGLHLNALGYKRIEPRLIRAVKNLRMQTFPAAPGRVHVFRRLKGFLGR